jgi:hypothetical protein
VSSSSFITFEEFSADQLPPLLKEFATLNLLRVL